METILSEQRYLVGNCLTEADIRLFCTLIRFDDVYVVYFKTNRNFIREFPNLANYTRDIFQTPGQCRIIAIVTLLFTSGLIWANNDVLPLLLVLSKGWSRRLLLARHDRIHDTL